MRKYIVLIELFDNDDRVYTSIVKTKANSEFYAEENIKKYLEIHNITNYKLKIGIDKDIQII